METPLCFPFSNYLAAGCQLETLGYLLPRAADRKLAEETRRRGVSLSFSLNAIARVSSPGVHLVRQRKAAPRRLIPSSSPLSLSLLRVSARRTFSSLHVTNSYGRRTIKNNVIDQFSYRDLRRKIYHMQRPFPGPLPLSGFSASLSRVSRVQLLQERARQDNTRRLILVPTARDNVVVRLIAR